MDLHFTGDLSGMANGLKRLCGKVGIVLDENGFPITVVQKEKPVVHAAFAKDHGEIFYGERCQFFRAFGLLAEHLLNGETEFTVDEKPWFTMNGPMFDVSQGNSAFNVKTLKKIIEDLALMGLNTLMIYCEDSYEVKEQPYFGYMRPRYSEDDMRELDAYADDFGIEMIPCIQTLAHLPDALRWRCFEDIKDYDACLLVGEEKTYAFIEDLITAATQPFKTKKIHIGMDEAWQLGRGSYMTKNGYRPPNEIMKEHLSRVYDILMKHDLEPMMWDDMFFRTIGDGDYYSTDPFIPEEVKRMVPPKMKCIYWDYYKQSEEEYDAQLAKQCALTDRIVFAGGTWTWLGFALNTRMTLNSTIPALKCCKKHGVKEVFMTTWGDNGTECPILATLFGCQLYAELGYADDYDAAKFKRRFLFCTGGHAEDFIQLDRLDIIPATVNRVSFSNYNTSKPLMWQDVLTGLADKNYEGLDLNRHYAELAADLKPAAHRNGEFDGMFDFLAHAADVLSVKSEMGIRLTAAYRANDRGAVRRFADEELPDLQKRFIALRKAHMKLWFDQYKPLGWDIMDMRYGAAIARIQSAIEELSAWLSGELETVEELDIERLDFNGIPGPISYMNFYGAIVSPSRIAPYA